MYNEGRKLEYLKETKYINPQLKKLLTTVFNKTETKETEIGKDIGEWTSSEIIEYYKLLFSASLNTLNSRHSYLKNYAEWCLRNNLLPDNQNHWMEINQDILQTCVHVGKQEQAMLTRKEMEDIIADLLNPRDQCLIYALFEGVEGKQFSELTELNMRQVKGNTLKLATRTIPVSDKLISLMQQSTDEYTYYAYGESGRELKYHLDDDNVFKMTSNSKEISQVRKRQRLYTNLMRIRDFVGNPMINATSLEESGRLDMVQNYMSYDVNLTFEDTLHKYTIEIENKYGRIYSMKKYLLTYAEYFRKLQEEK